jgi:hypothetical protein
VRRPIRRSRPVRSRIVRACACVLQADAIWYHGALAFERPIDTASVLAAA